MAMCVAKTTSIFRLRYYEICNYDYTVAQKFTKKIQHTSAYHPPSPQEIREWDRMNDLWMNIFAFN